MAKITRVRLELPSLLGDKYRAEVRYKITFAQSEVDAGATYSHKAVLIGDDTNTSNGIFDDGHDDPIRTLRNQQITAQGAPLDVTIDKGPFTAAELDEDFLLPDTIRALITVRPTPDHQEFLVARAQSNKIVLP